MNSSKEFTLTVARENFDEIAYRMITENAIYGLVDFSMNISGMNVILRYNNEKYISLSKYFEQEITKAELLSIFQKYFAITRDLPGYLLDEELINLDIDNVYYDVETKDLCLLYLPDLSCKNENALLEFIRQVIFSVSYKQDEDSSYIVKIMNYIKKKDFTVEGFNELIDKLSSEEAPSDVYDSPAHEEAFGETAVLGSANQEAYLVREKTGEKLVLANGEFVLGKDSANVDYCIDNNIAISRRHARLDKIDDLWYVIDTNSLNGTFLNGEKLVGNIANQLSDKDVIFLADEVFTFHDAK